MPQPVRFLYWNTGRRFGTQEQVLQAIYQQPYPPDVLVLGECLTDLSLAFQQAHGLEAMPYTILNDQPLPGLPAYRQPLREQQTQRVYFRAKAGLHLQHLTIYEDKDEDDPPAATRTGPHLTQLGQIPRFVTRLVLMRLEFAGTSTLVASVHLPTRRGGVQDETSLYRNARTYKTIIKEAAGRYLDQLGRRMVVVGDFNMNPFDAGMIEPDGFFALNNRAAIKHIRKVDHVPEQMFYNPSWSLLSDIDPVLPRQPRPAGSHYFEGAPSKSLYWHLYDQVLLSYELTTRFDAASLHLIRYQPMVQEMRNPPDNTKRHYSDHLPLSFILNL